MLISLDTISTCTGTVSVIGSFCAGAYQFYLGYLFEGADGFSPMLLLGWLLGDMCNVVGTFWTHQLTFQKVIACASTTNDVILALQHFYYKRKHKKYEEQHIDPEPVLVRGETYLAMKWNALLRPYILFSLVSAARAAAISTKLSDPTIYSQIDDDEIDLVFLIGQCMAWLAELSYSFALVPQVMENFSRKSTGSVSIVMFLADAIGSMSYLMTILMTANDGHHKVDEFLLEELPYLFGTASCLILDLLLLFQYFIYPQFVTECDNINASMDHINETNSLMPVRSFKSMRSYNAIRETTHLRI